MPLCPQVVNTPITVVQTADFTVSSVLPGDIPASMGEVNAAVQTSANGKNKVTYSTSAPGSTANTAGDIWFQNGTSAPYVGKVIAQYSGNGGTSWTSVTVSGLVIANIDAGTITAGTLNAINVTGCTITGGTVQTSSGVTSVSMNSSSNSLSFKYAGSVVGHILPMSSYGIMIHYGATADPSGGTRPQLFVGSGNISLQASASVVLGVSTSLGVTVTGTFKTSGAATFDTSITAGSASPGRFEFLSSSGNVRVAATYSNAVSSTRAMQINSSGLYGTVASTRRKKHHIENYAMDTQSLLQLPIRQFKYIESIDPDQDTQYGFIAEEAEALGLNELIQFDAEGIPDYFAYEKLPIFLLQLVQEQEARIKELEARG
jgi:hypothetical protein